MPLSPSMNVDSYFARCTCSEFKNKNQLCSSIKSILKVPYDGITISITGFVDFLHYPVFLRTWHTAEYSVYFRNTKIQIPEIQ